MKQNSTAATIACVCTSTEGLFIPNRQLSGLIAIVFGLFFITFLSGYWLAKHHELSIPVLEQTKEVPLADTAYEEELVASPIEPFTHEEDESPLIDPSLEDKTFYAQLIGFGTSAAAHRFTQQLQKKGIAVSVKTRYSKTPKGKQIMWYQVVTENYTNRKELEQLVEKVSRSERLTGAKIVSA